MEQLLNFISEVGVVIGVLGLILYAISGLFRHKGQYFEGTGNVNGYEIKGDYNNYGEFEGKISPTYSTGGYVRGSKNAIGRTLAAIGKGMIVWTVSWWALQFLSCFSCFFTKDLNALAHNDEKVGLLAFAIGVIAGVIEAINGAD